MHIILERSSRANSLLRVTLPLASYGQVQHLKREFAKIQSKPFALLDIQLLLGSEEDQPCFDHCQLHSYFPHVEATLEQEVAYRGPMDERRAWFLLSELSMGLELLGDNKQSIQSHPQPPPAVQK